MALNIKGWNPLPQQPNANGTYPNSKGGTELMYDRLATTVDSNLLDRFNIIVRRVGPHSIASDRINVFWHHNTEDDPEIQWMTNKSERDCFVKHVFVSNHQMNRFIDRFNMSHDECVVIQNAIQPIPHHQKPTDRISVVYHTTPHRGLGILIPVFQKLYDIHGDNIHLDVYSSFSIYGWSQRDQPYQSLFDAIRSHPGMSYHGAVPNEQIRTALQSSHIFAYPSVWPETSCIAAIEAMSAECLVVAPNLGALPETCANFAMMYQWSPDPAQHAASFANMLNVAIERLSDLAGMLAFQKKYTDSFYNWADRKLEWEMLLSSLIQVGKNRC